MSPNDKKLGELMLYIAEFCETDPTFGSVKLNKLLFYSDFLAFRRLGRSITGHTYQKLEHGPAPRAMLPVRRSLGGDLVFREESRYGRAQKKPIATRSADLSEFSAEEISLVDSVVEEWIGVSAAKISKKSHDDLCCWDMAELGEAIPYSVSLIGSQTPPTDEEREWADSVMDEARLALAGS